jgi:Ni/Fe-hydrogenase subunit HybB-like protein
MTTASISKERSTTGLVVLAVLALLAVLGLVAGVYRLANGLGETTNLSNEYAWGLWIVMDFTLIAFSGAAFTLAAVVYIFNLDKYRPVMRMAVLTGFLGYVSVLLILLIDLGRWDRFWAFIVYPNIHSPLFEISWCILLYTMVLALEFAPFLFERLNRPNIVRAIHRFSVPIVIAGITLSTLHQSTLGTLYTALMHKLHPLWATPLLPLFFLISSIGMGLSTVIMVVLIASRAFNRKVEMDVLGGLAKGSVAVWVIYLLFKLEHLLFAGQLSNAFAFDKYSVWYLIEMVVGVVLPIILFSMASVRKNKTGLLLTSLLVFIGVLLNRLNATIIGQEVTQATFLLQAETVEAATYTPSLIEWAVQIGVLAAGALAWYLVARYLPIFPEDVKEAH